MSKQITYLIPHGFLASIILHISLELLTIANELNVGVHPANRLGIVGQYCTLDKKL
jgi:MFS superfamily sulfate permease-like transporter